MKMFAWLCVGLLMIVPVTGGWAQSPNPALVPGSAAAAKEGAALADEAERLINLGDGNAPEAMALAERGAALGDAKAHVGIAYIYWKTGLKPKDFLGFVDRFLGMHDDLPVDDPLTGHALLMKGIVKNGDTATVEGLLLPRVDKGDSKAMFHLAMLKLVSNDATAAMELLDKASTAGYARAAVMTVRLQTAANRVLEQRSRK